jgi:hypothetical protein
MTLDPIQLRKPQEGIRVVGRSSSRLATLLLSVAVPVLVVAMRIQARACTAVFVSAGDAVLVGNNEDASMPLSKVWVVPGEGGKYSRFCLGYAGDNIIQGGVNEKWLWFDSFSVEAKPVAASPGEKVFEGDMHDKILAECATVEEVVALLHRYRNPFLSDNMLMVGDRTGASAIIEGNAVLSRRGPYQIITNFRQSEHPDGSTVCGRYRIAETMLKADPHVTIDGIAQDPGGRPPGGPCPDYLLLHLRPAEREAVSLPLPQLREGGRPGCEARAGKGEAQPEPAGALPDHVRRRGVRLPVRGRPGGQESGPQVPAVRPEDVPRVSPAGTW